MNKQEIIDQYLENNLELIERNKTANSYFRWDEVAKTIEGIFNYPAIEGRSCEFQPISINGEYVRNRFRKLKDKSPKWTEQPHITGFRKMQERKKEEFIKSAENGDFNGSINYSHVVGTPTSETILTTTNGQINTPYISNSFPGYLRYSYNEDREKGTAKIEDTVTEKLSDESIYEKYNVDKTKYRISQVWYKDASVGYKMSVLFTSIYKEDITNIDFKEEFKQFLNEYNINVLNKSNTRYCLNQDVNRTKDNALIISLADLHLDIASFKEETGKQSNIKIATDKALKAVTDILKRAYCGNTLEKIILIGGNDFFHANSSANTTQKGTSLDVDNRWNTSFKAGLFLMSSIIDLCAEFAPIEYYTCFGNHSPEREFYLSVAIDALYKKSNRVIVETGESSRKYFKYGNSAFMLSHDAPKKVKDCPIIFATERPDLFTCKFKFLLTGHLHSKNETFFMGTSENYGLVWKRMPSLATSDKWHFDSFFIGNQKSCIGIVINKEHGEIAEYVYND